MTLIVVPLVGCSTRTLHTLSIFTVTKEGDDAMRYGRVAIGLSGICTYNYDESDKKLRVDTCTSMFPVKIHIDDIFTDTGEEYWEGAKAFEKKFNYRVRVATVLYIVLLGFLLAGIVLTWLGPLFMLYFLFAYILDFALTLSANIVLTTAVSGLSNRLDDAILGGHYKWTASSTCGGFIMIWVVFAVLFAGFDNGGSATLSA